MLVSRRRIVVAPQVARPVRRNYICKPYPILPPVDNFVYRGEKKGPWWNWYSMYLLSSYWRARRRWALQNARYRCQQCKKGGRVLQVHHLSYARVGCEELEDVKVLCEDCHNCQHEQ